MLTTLLLATSGIAQSAALSISASPSTINPSNGQAATITYTNTVPVYKPSVTVQNSSNETVKSLVSYSMIGTNTRRTAWDGKDASGRIAPAGQYTVVFSGNTSSGAAIIPATTIVTVTTTATAPSQPPSGGGTNTVMSISVSPGAINVTEGQSTTVTYTNTQRIYSPSVTVRNSGNTIVRTLASYNLIGTRTRRAIWDGKDSAGRLVSAGQYTVVFDGKTSTGAAITPATAGITVTTTAAPPPPPPTEYSFAINSITPGAIDTTKGETTTINYNVPVTCNLRVVVKNSAGSEVRILTTVSNAAAGNRSIAWDGKTGAGAVVPDGSYTVTVESTVATPVVKPASGTVTVTASTVTPPPPPPPDPVSPLSVSVSPGTIDAGEQTTVTYTNTVAVYNPSLTVRNSSNTIVYSLISYTMIGTRTRTATWDGKNSSGQAVPAGQYTVVYEGKTSSGAAITPATTGVAVSSSAPAPIEYSFAINSITPGSIDTTKGETTTINYAVPVTCNLRVVVKNGAGAEVRTLTTVSNAAAGNRSIAWDGKNTTGAVVANGTYTVTVESTGTTPAVKPASGTVTVTASTVTPPPPPPPPPATGSEKGQIIEGGGSANFAWLKYSGYKAGVAFLSPKTGSITQITLQWKKSSGYGAGNYGTFNFELQTNGTGNFPSGTVIGRATGINPSTAMDGYIDGAFHFPISASLTAGQIYHLVITNTDSNPGTNWSSPNGLMTRVQPWDGTGNRLAYYSSGSWKPWSSGDNPWNTSGGNNVNGHHVPTMLTWSDGSNTGDPYYSASISSGAKFYGSSRAGEYITWNGASTTIGKVGVSVKRVGSPAGALIYHLERVGSGDVATGAIATAAQVGTVQTWVYATLPSAVTLTQGQSYRLWFESPSSSSSAYYASAPVYGESRPPAWLEAGWGGTHCYYVSGSGNLNSSNKSMDLSFSMQ